VDRAKFSNHLATSSKLLASSIKFLEVLRAPFQEIYSNWWTGLPNENPRGTPLLNTKIS